MAEAARMAEVAGYAWLGIGAGLVQRHACAAARIADAGWSE
jgi:hypothetical protein